MKKLLQSFIVSSLILASSSPAMSLGLTRDELAERFPGIEEGSTKPENKKILCPFHRLLERAGVYDSSKSARGPLIVSVIKIAHAARDFGCSVVGCTSVTSLVSGGQLLSGTTYFGAVNVEALHTSIGVSHECGLAFEKGGKVVSDKARNHTLALLSARADSFGRLSFDDIKAVKQQICDEQNVAIDLVQASEVGLLYSFLGGNERGFIEYSDVERFLHAELPKTIGIPSFPKE